VRGADRIRYLVADLAGEPHVVEGELERLARRLDEVDDARSDVLRLLTAVSQLVELERQNS
jgi:ubiquinone biosynthesis protein UbiJ